MTLIATLWERFFILCSYSTMSHNYDAIHFRRHLDRMSFPDPKQSSTGTGTQSGGTRAVPLPPVYGGRGTRAAKNGAAAAGQRHSKF